jgi:hypothetical protein
MGVRLLFATLGLLAGTSSAAASVWWDAPDECGTADQLIERVAAQVGRPLALDDVTARAHVVNESGGYRATLVVASDPARMLTGATCDEVVDAVSLILALAVREQPAVSMIVAPRPVSAPRQRPHVALGVRLVGDGMTLPVPTVGIGPDAEVTWGPWTGGAAVAIWNGATASPGTSSEIAVRLTSGVAMLCRQLGPSHACGIATTGPMTGRGMSTDSASATRWWTAAGVGLGGERGLGARVMLGFDVEALVALARPRFVFDDGRDGYRTPSVTLRLAMSLRVRIFGKP